MKRIFDIIFDIIDEANKDLKGKLIIAPAVLAAIISGATTIGSKIIADTKAKKLAAKADKEAAIEKVENERKAMESANIARGIARGGDPTLAAKKRNIAQSAADVVGRAVATSGSTQEVIKAAQGVQRSKDIAEGRAESEAGLFKTDAKKFLAQRVTAAGAQRLAGNVAIDARLAQALEAIGAGAQATVDTTQNIGKIGVDAFTFGGRKKKPVTPGFSIPV